MALSTAFDEGKPLHVYRRPADKSREEHTHQHSEVPCHSDRRAFLCDFILCGQADLLCASGLEFTDCRDRLPPAGNTCCYCKRSGGTGTPVRRVVLKYKCSHRENISKELFDPSLTLK